MLNPYFAHIITWVYFNINLSRTKRNVLVYIQMYSFFVFKTSFFCKYLIYLNFRKLNQQVFTK
ncbi:hypothetical protein GLOIN_2v1542647 [Rhizophagus irregularis DAOM 181602=DAOM 197198]|uniref:Uncharacterized protein n=1 Tax=Rhizophagus irregularis (strain DAOM 181602 / DAOM 197198 / MUCL 43194) TaxID=747089 RepID=A0A2P4QJW2_RHIID|nr:hypothetical protein GLOIN_2v1542647 [Rhizophagus irregularis DAOM 181602=DAOM 197198]POG77924.1 hypothetical protein GLOIN_2v1542647 [Rhizophagus irregularis DAOM 181602=DAOM 197198]|eukprot:XP_025184790.1 hypothetical protein GLOIN_2v1542647 [Rhizophagus irregularis DAOM 181602=DAOM 197198]